MKREWVKLYLPEPGKIFEALPATAKAYAALLLNRFDEKGSLYCGERDTAEAIAIELKADKGERRLIRKYIPMLLDPNIRYLVREGDYVRIRKFEKRQSSWRHEPTTKEQRTDNEPDANRQRRSNEQFVSARNDTRHDSCSLNLKREEDKERDRELNARAREAEAPQKNIAEQREDQHNLIGTGDPWLLIALGYRQRFRKKYAGTYLEYGKAPSIEQGDWEKCYNQAAVCIEGWKPAAIKALDNYFASDDPFVLRNKHAPSLLASQFTRYHSPEQTPKSKEESAERVRRVVAEAAKVMLAS